MRRMYSYKKLKEILYQKVYEIIYGSKNVAMQADRQISAEELLHGGNK